MNDETIRSALEEVSRDIPQRTDDEAVRRLVAAFDRRRRIRRAVVGAAAAAVLAVIGVASLQDEGAVDVASDAGPAPTAPASVRRVSVEHYDPTEYTGIHPPLVALRRDARTVSLLDAMSLDVFATVRFPTPLVHAAGGRATGRIYVTDLDGSGSPRLWEVDLDTGEVVDVGSARGYAAAGARSEDAPIGLFAFVEFDGSGRARAIVVEDPRGGEKRLAVPEGAAVGPSGPMAWSSGGRLAVAQTDGTTAVLAPSTATSYADAEVVPVDLTDADWSAPDTLVGVSRCCSPDGAPAVVSVDIGDPSTATVVAHGAHPVAVDTGGSPWGTFLVGADGTLRSTHEPEVTHLRDVAALTW